jgi:hypothetical protein
MSFVLCGPRSPLCCEYDDFSLLRFMLGSCLVYSSTLKMEATCSIETSVDFQRTARRYIPEDRISVLEIEDMSSIPFMGNNICVFNTKPEHFGPPQRPI